MAAEEDLNRKDPNAKLAQAGAALLMPIQISLYLGLS